MPSILHVTQGDMGDNLQVDPSTDKITVKQATESITGAVKLYDRLDSNDPTGALSSNMGKELNELYMEDLNNGAGSIVYRYIEDGELHTVGEVWLSSVNVGYFRCLENNSDDYVESTRWERIDDSTNTDKINYLSNYYEAATTISYGSGSAQIIFGKTGKLVNLRLIYTSPPMVTVDAGVSYQVGTIPAGYSPRVKVVSSIVNKGVVVGSISFTTEGIIIMQSSIEGVSIVDNMEIGTTYFVL